MNSVVMLEGKTNSLCSVDGMNELNPKTTTLGMDRTSDEEVIFLLMSAYTHKTQLSSRTQSDDKRS